MIYNSTHKARLAKFIQQFEHLPCGAKKLFSIDSKDCLKPVMLEQLKEKGFSIQNMAGSMLATKS